MATISNTDNGRVISGGVKCEECGAVLMFNLPLAVEIVAKCMQSFADLHQFCGHQVPIFSNPSNAFVVVAYHVDKRSGIVAVKASHAGAKDAADRWAELASFTDIEEWMIGDEAEPEP